MIKPWMFCGVLSKITFVAAATAANSGAATLTINKPSGTLEGDLMISFVSNGNSRTWTGDTGWTEVVDDAVNGGIRIAYKVAGASEGASYTFTAVEGNATSQGIIVTYRGATYSLIGTVSAAASPTVAPTITTTAVGTILGYFNTVSASRTFTVPSGMGSVQYLATNGSGELFSQKVPVGATGTRTSQVSGPASGRGVLVSMIDT